MRHGGLTGYKIGLGVIALFSLVLLTLVIIQATGTKDDSKTYTVAQSVASKLESYITSKNELPSSLSAAGISTHGQLISYSKLSDSRFRFCVTYKTTSDDFSASDVTSRILTSEFGDSYSGNSDSSYLQILTTHHKGANCQTITPTLYDQSPLNYNPGYSGSLDDSGPATYVN